jgi:hypothetical protein
VDEFLSDDSSDESPEGEQEPAISYAEVEDDDFTSGDDFSAEPETSSLPAFNPEPALEQHDDDEESSLPAFNPESFQEQYAEESSLPAFNPEPTQWEDDGPSLPTFTPEADDEDSGLPAFSYEPEAPAPQSSEEEAEEQDEFAGVNGVDVVGEGDFAFARKLQ